MASANLAAQMQTLQTPTRCEPEYAFTFATPKAPTPVSEEQSSVHVPMGRFYPIFIRRNSVKYPDCAYSKITLDSPPIDENQKEFEKKMVFTGYYAFYDYTIDKPIELNCPCGCSRIIKMSMMSEPAEDSAKPAEDSAKPCEGCGR